MYKTGDYTFDRAIFLDPMTQYFRVKMFFSNVSRNPKDGLTVEIFHDQLATFYHHSPVEKSDDILHDSGLIEYALTMAVRELNAREAKNETVQSSPT